MAVGSELSGGSGIFGVVQKELSGEVSGSLREESLALLVKSNIKS